jgi:hypothetical protein
MATLTYSIDSTTNAYTILRDGEPWIFQPFPRNVAGTAPFATAAASEAEAQEVIAELTAAGT